MSEKDVVENVDSPGEIAIPIADNSTPGIASFDSNDFTVGTDGKVSSIVERGIPQYLGKITGTGTGTTDLNWEVDTNTVKQNKPIKLGEYIMLTERFNQFVPGDIFRITNVQIEGSKYTVKTNNVRALSLASIVGPQGEQGSEGPQGVPYLAYTGSIESTIDPAPGSIMRLEDGHFNRTPIINAGEYQDVVTVDWYNKTTHKAFMVTGYIQSKDSATNQWVALITAATDITGAVGPQGKEGAGIADIVDIDYPHGEFTSVQYDTTDGIKMRGIAKYLRDDGETYQIPTSIDVPLVAGAGILIDKKNTEEKVEVKSLNSNLENGTGLDSLVQKYSREVDETHYASSTTGESDVCLGEANTSSGKRNIIGGKLNENTGSNNLIGGLRNNISSNYNVVGGQDNTSTQGHDNLIGGQQNTIKSYDNVVAGHENNLSENGRSNIVAGEQNFLGIVVNSIICGDNDNIQIEQLLNGIKAGHDLLNNSDVQGKALLGHYNSPKTNTLVEVGNGTGTSDNARKNAFEVLADGRAKVQTAPVEDDDIVRLKELNAVSGGGGKLYLHRVILSAATIVSNLVFYVYNRSNAKLTLNDIAGSYFLASVTNSPYSGVVSCIIQPSTAELSTHKLITKGVVINDNAPFALDGVTESYDIHLSDTAIEL